MSEADFETIPVAVLDACALHSAGLRDFLLRLAAARAYRPRWSERIHQEWIASVLKRRPGLDPERLERTRRMMDSAFDDALVSGHEALSPTFGLKDPNDGHVLAAAVVAKAGFIVTENLKDFPPATLEPFGIIAIRPDAFALALFCSDEAKVVSAAKFQRAGLKSPPKSVAEYLAGLEKCGLPKIAAALGERSDAL